jgi:hypothetical protein
VAGLARYAAPEGPAADAVDLLSAAAYTAGKAGKFPSFISCLLASFGISHTHTHTFHHHVILYSHKTHVQVMIPSMYVPCTQSDESM